MLSRKNVAVLVAEALGTAILTFSVLAVTRSAIGIPYFTAIGVGLTLVLLVLALGSVSGAHVNPAITIGLWTLRKIDTGKAILYLAAQFVGAIGAFRLYEYLLDRPLESIAGEEFMWPVFIAEAIGAGLFGMGVAAALYQKYSGGQNAFAIGGSLALGILIAGTVSSGLLNPAVALGVQSWDKTYVLAPVLGSIVGMNLYGMLFAGDKQLLSAIGVKTSSAKPAAKKTAKKRR